MGTGLRSRGSAEVVAVVVRVVVRTVVDVEGVGPPIRGLHLPSNEPLVGLPLSTLPLSGVLSRSASGTVLGIEEGVREGLVEAELEM